MAGYFDSFGKYSRGEMDRGIRKRLEFLHSEYPELYDYEVIWSNIELLAGLMREFLEISTDEDKKIEEIWRTVSFNYLTGLADSLSSVSGDKNGLKIAEFSIEEASNYILIGSRHKRGA